MDDKIEFDFNEPTNKFYLSDQDIVYVRNRDGEFELSDDGKYCYPAEIDIMWGGLAKEHVEDMLKQQKKKFASLRRRTHNLTD